MRPVRSRGALQPRVARRRIGRRRHPLERAHGVRRLADVLGEPSSSTYEVPSVGTASKLATACASASSNAPRLSSCRAAR